MPNHPLTGIRVIEVANYMAGPFCAMQLADLGADVIKVENPDGGDTARDSAPFLDGESSPFIRLNRNKRSLAMNLKAPEGKELFQQLVEASSSTCRSSSPEYRSRFGRQGATSRPERFQPHWVRPTRPRPRIRRSARPTASSPSAPRLHATGGLSAMCSSTRSGQARNVSRTTLRATRAGIS